MKRARVIRIDMGFQVGELAARLGIDKDILVRYERGTRPLPDGKLLIMSVILGAKEETLD